MPSSESLLKTTQSHSIAISTRLVKAVADDEWSHLSFRLRDDFIQQYKDKPVSWGFPIGAGNTLGELTFISKYSRLKADGTKERWYECCRRVVEGMFSIQKDHTLRDRTPWNTNKAQRSAEEAYDRMFNFKWTPPGRGLWAMGTKMVHEEGSSAPLQNCSFLSTEHLGPRNPTLPFVRLMEMSMWGIGCGFDTRGAGKLEIHSPSVVETDTYVVPDSREGWAQSIDRLLRSYFLPSQPTIEFDYSEIRAAGMPLVRFGGTSAGPEPLIRLHASLRKTFDDRHGQKISSTDIVDVANLIGKAVVAGSIRRTAEVAFGENDDKEFLELKNPSLNPERMGPDGWGYLSNNSVFASVGDDLSHLVDAIAENGEPGVMWLDLAQKYGRLGDPVNNRDAGVRGGNPCLEQSLYPEELCTLVELFPTRCDDMADFLRTVKFAYLYGKSVTLMPTHWEESNAVMTRNRRIGLSITGVAYFAETKGWNSLREWCDAGYEEVQRYDKIYSEWFGIRESIKTTSVKPSGTVSLLAGVWPGVHWPVSQGDYLRRQRFRYDDPIVETFKEAGYQVEPDVMDPSFTVVVEFPVTGPAGRSETEVPVWEKVALANLMASHWADNMVSATFTFMPAERDQIGSILRAFDGKLKTMSFLPLHETSAYEQMPYESVSDEKFEAMRALTKPLNWDNVYDNGSEAEGEKFCNNDVCEVPRKETV